MISKTDAFIYELGLTLGILFSAMFSKEALDMSFFPTMLLFTTLFREEKQRTATYRIDCRFNKVYLISRLQDIIAHKEHIMVSNLDALEFLHGLNDDVFVYLDPPYYEKGKCLYMNHYTNEDHRKLADFLQNTAHFNWILSYDDVPQIRKLYSTLELYRFPLKYTVEMKRVGYELLTHSHNIVFPESLQIKRPQSGIIHIERI